MKQEFIYLLVFVVGVFVTLIAQTRKKEILSFWQGFLSARKLLRTIDYETPVEDLHTTQSAQALMDIKRCAAVDKAKATLDRISDFITEKNIAAQLHSKFKQHFIEFNNEAERLPHMLSLVAMQNAVTVNSYMEFTSADYCGRSGVWVNNETSREYRFYINCYGVTFNVQIYPNTLDLDVGFAVYPWSLQAGITQFYKYIDDDVDGKGVDNICDEIFEVLTSLCDKTPHLNNREICDNSFEDLVLNLSSGFNCSRDKFLLEYIDNELDSRSAFFDPLAFGQAVLEGKFTSEELNAADVHGYFLFTTTYDKDVVNGVIDVLVPKWTGGNVEVQLASTFHQAAYVTPQAFTEMPMAEFMFYYYQLGMLLKGLFIQKHPELIVKAHDNLWS